MSECVFKTYNFVVIYRGCLYIVIGVGIVSGFVVGMSVKDCHLMACTIIVSLKVR